ncbi:hypothetical protein CLOSTHATH_05941 [Hungatella hathewayi DSM 13479]|uniref:Uncharacterized protein n=1 Tax=Hungatella hathewayi DSM 13479 TaxID=566550 RepID=D3AQN5_9FIRM|nr:hypothetical protein CLOSTHATH_05941 [Hungatella hathewayi DSM 13479]
MLLRKTSALRAFMTGRRPFRPSPFNLHTNRTADFSCKHTI